MNTRSPLPFRPKHIFILIVNGGNAMATLNKNIIGEGGVTKIQPNSSNSCKQNNLISWITTKKR